MINPEQYGHPCMDDFVKFSEHARHERDRWEAFQKLITIYEYSFDIETCEVKEVIVGYDYPEACIPVSLKDYFRR